MDKKKPINVIIIGKPSDTALIGAGNVMNALHARNSREWGKHFTEAELAERQKRIDAGLMPYDCQYTRQDMIDFANKAVSAYMDYGAVVTDHTGHMYPDWIDDNLPVIL